MSNVLNYTEQGGAKTVIGGELEVAAGASVTGITTATLVDNLTSTDTDKALTAAQGKALKTLVDAKIATSAIVNDLTTGGIAVPLSAEQGKTLAARKAANQTASVEASSPTTAEFNGLLTKLKAAGLMVAD
jgi:hypothetical protein